MKIPTEMTIRIGKELSVTSEKQLSISAKEFIEARQASIEGGNGHGERDSQVLRSH